jgi:cysteine desulfurase NifS/selenium donor protein
MNPIYLDYNATTPVDPEVVAELLPWLNEGFGNPSSSHPYGQRAKQAVELARTRLATALGCTPAELVFTSGGTEANNQALIGAALANSGRGRHIITSAVEHPAVLNPLLWLERQGFAVTILPVDGSGRVDPESVRQVITGETILISIMHANNEVGTVQPLAEISAIARQQGILLHTDAAQSLGKLPVRVDELGVDLLTVAGHKLYAPKGVGALYVRSGVKVNSYLHGAGHESGRRAGTENVPYIAALGKAAELAHGRLAVEADRIRELRDYFHSRLAELACDVLLNGHATERLPNTLNVSFSGVNGAELLEQIPEIAASTGSACHDGCGELSGVLKAMGLSRAQGFGAVRFSLGRLTTKEELDRAAGYVAEKVNELRSAVSRAPVAHIQAGLTTLATCGGCAAKLSPQDLAQVLSTLPGITDPNVLIGTRTADDAAVYRVRDDLAIVQTVDFFTPVVDDPYTFGQITAANALSDIYAMGAEPLFALNIVSFPAATLPLEVLAKILQGGAAKAAEAGISIIGGHTIIDAEPKYGLAVTAVIHPDKVVSNASAQVGDRLILTKPLGLGIITAALKQGKVSAAVLAEATRIMVTLNRAASAAMVTVGAHACTDVTGFGLLGHLRELVSASGASALLHAGRIPVLEEARNLVSQGIIPGNSRRNLEFLRDCLDVADGVGEDNLLLLADAQTSGGLLIAVAADKVALLKAELVSNGVAECAEIGVIVAGSPGRIRIEA